MRLAPMYKRGIGAEGNVVQEQPLARPADIDPPLLAAKGVERNERVAAVETEIAREMVAGPERDADERQIAVDCHLGHRRQRAVTAGHADGRGLGGARERSSVVAPAEHAGLDS